MRAINISSPRIRTSSRGIRPYCEQKKSIELSSYK